MAQLPEHELLVHRLYDAANGSDSWEEVLESISQRLDGRLVSVGRQHFPAGNILYSSAIDPSLLETFGSLFSDPSANGTDLLRGKAHPGMVIRWDDLVPEREFKRQELYQRVFRPARRLNDLSVLISMASDHVTVFSLHRREGQQHLPNQELEPLLPVLSHLGRAFEIGVRLGNLTSFRNAYATAIEQTAGAAFVIDTLGKVVDANAAGRRLLERGDDVGLSRGELVATRAGDSRRLRQLLRNALIAVQRRSTFAGARVEIPSSSSRGSFLVDAIPFPAAPGAPPIGQAAIVLLIRRSKDRNGGAVIRLKEEFGLSPQQTKVLSMLIDGLSHTEIAEALAISSNTLKTHVRRLYAKLGCSSRVDLFRLAGPI